MISHERRLHVTTMTNLRDRRQCNRLRFRGVCRVKAVRRQGGGLSFLHIRSYRTTISSRSIHIYTVPGAGLRKSIELASSVGVPKVLNPSEG